MTIDAPALPATLATTGRLRTAAARDLASLVTVTDPARAADAWGKLAALDKRALHENCISGDKLLTGATDAAQAALAAGVRQARDLVDGLFMRAETTGLPVPTWDEILDVLTAAAAAIMEPTVPNQLDAVRGTVDPAQDPRSIARDIAHESLSD